jgi:predicted nucleic acid-binding protein
VTTRRVFVDTSAWYAVADSHDANHEVATRVFTGLIGERARLLTTNHVISETYTLLRVRLGGEAARAFLRSIRASVEAERVHVSLEWEGAAEELLLQYGDQDFSYVDATSFVTMRRLSIQDAFTFDRHFAAAGFSAVGYHT